MQETGYCQNCEKPLEQLPGGHRRRVYCSELCRQQAYRTRIVQREKERCELRLISLHERIQRYSAETQQRLLFTFEHYGIDAAELQADSIDQEKEQKN